MNGAAHETLEAPLYSKHRRDRLAALTLSVCSIGSEELGSPLEEGKSVSFLALRSNCLVHTNLSSPAPQFRQVLELTNCADSQHEALGLTVHADLCGRLREKLSEFCKKLLCCLRELVWHVLYNFQHVMHQGCERRCKTRQNQASTLRP